MPVSRLYCRLATAKPTTTQFMRRFSSTCQRISSASKCGRRSPSLIYLRLTGRLTQRFAFIGHRRFAPPRWQGAPLLLVQVVRQGALRRPAWRGETPGPKEPRETGYAFWYCSEYSSRLASARFRYAALARPATPLVRRDSCDQ